MKPPPLVVPLESHIIRPVICYCSGTHQHKTDHIECRCDGWERFRAQRIAPYKPEHVFPVNLRDEDGYALCRYCKKIQFKNWLVQCPYCDKFFKGPTFWFDKKFHYECEDCG